ncbi:MAG TPA: DNA primase [Actinomycetota bacterium]|nr:DNA primase [Actinomycetota bacterium]
MPGRIVTEDIQELRERTDLIEVIGAHMSLKKAGRTYKGLCCFHQEKTPSFTVDPARQLFHCFGCGKGGDIFTFLREAEGMTFTEAAERLAERAGMTLRFEGGAAKKEGGRAALIAACKEAAAFYSEFLKSRPEAAAARKYLEGRGLTPEDAQAWQLGFSPPGRDTLYRHLLDKKFTSKQVVDAGLVLVGERGEHRDRFRGRVMFPIPDLSGNIVGFGARAMGDDQPKYLNSPSQEGSIYQKSKLLYGLDRSRADMVKGGTAIVTEGYTDVIGLHKAGYPCAVATCGTALSEEHFALIKRFCERVVLAFDADAAGAIASERGFGIHAKVGLEVLVAPPPKGKDPADVALEEGHDAVEAMLDGAVPLMRFVLEQEMQRQKLDTAEGKARAVRSAVALLSWEPNRVARSEHGLWLAARVGVAPEQIQLELSDLDRGERRESATPRQMRQPGHVRVEREALSIVLNSAERLKEARDWVTTDHFTEQPHRVLWTALSESTGTNYAASVMDLLPDDDSRRLAAELALAPMTAREEEEVFSRLEAFKLTRRIDDLRARLARLDSKVEPQEHNQIFEELMHLDELRRSIESRGEDG